MKFRPPRKMLVSVGILIAVYVLWVLATPIAMPRPTNLGVHDNGQLAECPDSPNCVSSFANDEVHGISPIACNEPVETVFAELTQLLESQPRVNIIEQTDNYIHAECTTLIMRYTDDLEFLAHPADGVIHVRSASRLGHSDLGKNRQRVEQLRKELNESLKTKDAVQ